MEQLNSRALRVEIIWYYFTYRSQRLIVIGSRMDIQTTFWNLETIIGEVVGAYLECMFEKEQKVTGQQCR